MTVTPVHFPPSAHISTSPSSLGFTNSFARASKRPCCPKELKDMTDLKQFLSTSGKFHLFMGLPKTPSVPPRLQHTLCKWHPPIYTACLKFQCFDTRNGKSMKKIERWIQSLDISFAGHVTFPELLLCPPELSCRKLVAHSSTALSLGVLSESRRPFLSRTSTSFTYSQSSLTSVIFSNILRNKTLENIQKIQRETKINRVEFFLGGFSSAGHFY